MDRSETYVKMCEKATEIQLNWKPAKGDFIWGNDYFREKPNSIFVYGDWIEPDDEYQTGWSAYDGPNPCSKCQTLVKHDTLDFFSDIWLPRQDQLQEMTQNKLYPMHLTKDFYLFLWKGDGTVPHSDPTMEQLWLAFVMKEKYTKTWDGENWK
jgi:hypothetical protein